MSSDGVMTEIRSLLHDGMFSGEIIDLGYKPSTVYKVQRQLNRQEQRKGGMSSEGGTRPPAATADNKIPSALEAENIRLSREVETLEAHLECIIESDGELAAEIQALRERVKVLEAEAVTEGQLGQLVKDLQSQLEHEIHNQAAMRQRMAQWQQKFEAEQAARQTAQHKYDNALIILP